MNSLRSLGRAIEYEIERQIDRARRRRADRAGDPPLGRSRRPHALDAHQGGLVRLPLLPRARPRAGRADRRDARRGGRDRCPSCPPARRARLAGRVGDQREPRPGCSSAPRAWPTTPRRRWSRSTAAPPRDVVNWANGDVLGHLNETGLSPVVLPLAPDGLAELVGLVAAGTISRSQAKDVLAECLSEPKRPEAGRRGARARRRSATSASSKPSSTRCSPTNADVVADYRAGDDKVRKKKRGFAHGRGDEGAPGPAATPRSSTSSSTRSSTPA